MAADESLDDGVIDYSPFKCRKKDGYLWGIAGNDIPSYGAVEDWLFALAPAKRSKKNKYLIDTAHTIPKWTTKAKFEALVVTPSGRILSIMRSGSVHPVYSKFWAIGSGREVCMGAMASGASAIQAVRLAIRYNSGCKGTPRSVSL